MTRDAAPNPVCVWLDNVHELRAAEAFGQFDRSGLSCLEELRRLENCREGECFRVRIRKGENLKRTTYPSFALTG